MEGTKVFKAKNAMRIEGTTVFKPKNAMRIEGTRVFKPKNAMRIKKKATLITNVLRSQLTH